MLEKNRETSNLHHAVDAIILAALSRKYIELALDNNKLYEIWREHKVVKEKYYEYIQRYKNNKNIAIPQYSEYLETCKKKMHKYYYMSEYQTEKYLLNPNKIPCKFDNLKDEVLVRTIDNNQELFYNLTHELYEAKFADSLQMPLVSAKPERKFTGAITSDNAVKKTEQSYKTSIKTISENNYSVLPSNKYYCIEVYKNNKDETSTRAIKMIDVIKRNGKLYLRCDNPEDYKKHVMYLFKNDYIQVINKGKIKFEGFYASVKNINKSSFYLKEINSPKAMPKTIAKKDIIKKYNVDILGKKGGEIKCGEPLLSIMPKR